MSGRGIERTYNFNELKKKSQTWGSNGSKKIVLKKFLDFTTLEKNFLDSVFLEPFLPHVWDSFFSRPGRSQGLLYKHLLH
jgi:hypothetical protein